MPGAANSSCAPYDHRVSKTHRPAPSMNSFSILDVQHLTKAYPTGAGQLTVLHDISFTLDQGATCSILGPSGSGKTTLLGLAAGLDLPTSGFGDSQRDRARHDQRG